MPRNLNITFSDNEFRRVADALREVSRDLPGKLRAELKKAVRPIIVRAKANVLAMPVRGRGHTGFRRRLAAGVKAEAATGNRPAVSVVATLKDSDERSLPRYTDSRSGWRHPVFGNRHTWAAQAGHPWFTPAFSEARPEVQERLHHVLEEAADQVHRAGSR